jgi:hypothetical protein
VAPPPVDSFIVFDKGYVNIIKSMYATLNKSIFVPEMLKLNIFLTKRAFLNFLVPHHYIVG